MEYRIVYMVIKDETLKAKLYRNCARYMKYTSQEQRRTMLLEIDSVNALTEPCMTDYARLLLRWTEFPPELVYVYNSTFIHRIFTLLFIFWP